MRGEGGVALAAQLVLGHLADGAGEHIGDLDRRGGERVDQAQRRPGGRPVRRSARRCGRRAACSVCRGRPSPACEPSPQASTACPDRQRQRVSVGSRSLAGAEPRARNASARAGPVAGGPGPTWTGPVGASPTRSSKDLEEAASPSTAGRMRSLAASRKASTAAGPNVARPVAVERGGDGPGVLRPVGARCRCGRRPAGRPACPARSTPCRSGNPGVTAQRAARSRAATPAPPGACRAGHGSPCTRSPASGCGCAAPA